jgi:YesN/AraC family two-component response regulator
MDKTSYILGGLDLLTQSAEKQKTNTYWTVIYIKQGIGIYLLESDLRPINQGDVIILPPKVSYSFAAAELGDEYNVNIDAVVLRFDNAWLTNLLAVFRTLNEVVLKIREMADPYAVEGPKWMKLSALMDQLSSSPAAQRAVIILQILELISTPKDLIKILHTSPYQDISLKEKRERIDRYINTNFIGKITLEEVAAYLGINRTYFCMFFKKHYGKGFADYLNDLRVDKAAALLLQGNRAITDIARECGYKTVPYFNRAFKRSKGMTPGEYRKKCQSL